MKSVIDGIYRDGLCLGCGLCESICGKESVEMKLQSDGFFKPSVKVVNKVGEKIIENICPGLNIENDLTFTNDQKLWGRVEQLFSGYSADTEIRTAGSSGGIVSAIGVYMLENNLVDAVLQVGGDSEDYERNRLKVSRKRADVLSCASSRYAPALIFDKIIEIFDNSDETFCFIGKPCDISALKNLLSVYPQYTDRIKLTVSIMCAGMPSFNGTKSIIQDFNAHEPVTDLVYRGNGWPGFFSFTDKFGKRFQKTYNDSWGKTLNQHLNYRCKICPDGIGLQADIAVGDAWETSNGYPDFSEKDGQSLVIVRTPGGVKVLESACQNGSMIFTPLQEEKIALMQPYQYYRRKRIGARFLAVLIAKQRILNYKNIKMWQNFFHEKPYILFKEFIGTLKRSLKSGS